MFQIVGDKGQIRSQTITYGSLIRLVHYTTGLTVVASNNEDNYDDDSPYKTVYLRNNLTPYEEMAAQWEVMTRYRLRNEGDPVMSSDFVILRSFLFKRKYLTSIPPKLDLSPNVKDLLVALTGDAFTKLGWQIHLVQPYSDISPTSENAEYLQGGAYVRLNHQEVGGHLMVRCDDESILTSNIAPLGRVCDRLSIDCHHGNGVFVRAGSVLSDPGSAMAMWQLVPEELDRPHPLKSGSGIRLRHVLSGCYLCIRRVHPKDTECIKKNAHKVLNERTTTDSSSSSLKGKSSGGADNLQSVIEEWTVATTPSPDNTTVFVISSADVFEESIVTGGGQESTFISARENVFFVHNLTRMTLQLKVKPESGANRSRRSKKHLWEDYAEDIPVRPAVVSANLAILSEAYRVEIVNKDDVQDLVYVARYLALAKAALAAVQFTHRMDQLFLPLFQHLNVALFTLLGWVGGEYESDGCLAPHPKIARCLEAISSIDDEQSEFDESLIVDEVDSFAQDNIVGESDDESNSEENLPDEDVLEGVKAAVGGEGRTPRSVYSMCPWVGSGTTEYSKSALTNPIDSYRDGDGVHTASYRVNRQNLISDSRLLDVLVEFTQVVYLLVSQQTMHLSQATREAATADSSLNPSDGAAIGDCESRAELEAVHKVPPLVTGCCVLIHDLIHACVCNNRRNAVRILSVRGSLLNLMDQEILGWRPAIRSLLVALKTTKLGTVVRTIDTFDTSNILSEQDIQNLITKTYFLYMKNDEAAVHILDLVTTLCSPGELPNRIFQDLITNVLFNVVKSDKQGETMNTAQSEAETETHVLTDNTATHCLLFSTRYFNRSSWEILLKVHYDMSSVDSPPQSVKRGVKAELDGLKALFVETTGDVDAYLTRSDAERILCQLGLAGACLVEESSSLEGSTLTMFVDWWWENRRIYLPSSMKELNNMSRQQATAEVVDMGDVSDIAESDEESKSDSRGKDSDDEPEIAVLPKDHAAHTTLFGKLFGFRSGARKMEEGLEESIPPGTKKSDTMTKARRRDRSRSPPRVPGDHPLSRRRPSTLSSSDIVDMQLEVDRTSPMVQYERLRNAFGARVPRFFIGTYDDYSRLLKRPVHRVREQSETEVEGAYTGLSLLLNMPMGAAKKKLLQARHAQLDAEWMNFRVSLSRGSFERDWIRRAVNLLSELCRGKNNFAQNKIRNIFPAPLVLEMLDYGESVDKMVACSLLLNLFVEHDFVFSVRALTSVQACALSLHEYDASPHIDAGLLFNSMTRVKSVMDLDTAYSMRRKLWDFVRFRLDQLNLSKGDATVARYNVSFLILLRKLLMIGFFDESPAFLAESQNLTALARSNGLIAGDRSMFPCFRRGRVEEFDETTISKALVSKVDRSMTAHSDGLEAVRKGVINILKNDRDVGRLTDEEFEAINYRIHSSSGVSIGSESIDLVERYFKSVFGDPNQILAYREVLAILALTHDMQQMSRAKRIVSTLSNAEKYFRRDVLAGDVEIETLSPSDRITFGNDDRKLITKLLQLRVEDDKLFNRSLLSASLHQNNDIKHSAYYLMYRRQSLSIDLKNSMDSVRYVVNADEAYMLRLLTHFQQIADSYSDDLFDVTLKHSPVYDSHRLRMVNFAIDALTAVCYHSFIQAANEVYFPQNPLDISRGPDDPYGTEDDGIQLKKLETDHSYTQNLLANADRVLSLLGLTCDIATTLPRPSRRECHNIIGEFISHQIHRIKRICTSRKVQHDLRNWDELSDNEKRYVDSVLSFCASACTGAASLTQTHLPAASRFALQYMWKSPGATRIVDSLCMHCHLASELIDCVMLRSVEDKIMNGIAIDEPVPDAISILVSVVSSGQRDGAFTEAMRIIKRQVLDNGAMGHLIRLDMINPSKVEIQFHVQLLRLLSALALMGIEEDIETLKQNAPKDFCRRVLSNESPLHVKLCVINIARKLYTMDEVPVVDYVQQDLKTLVDLLNKPDSSPQQYSSIESTIVDYLDVCARYILSLVRRCQGYNELDTTNTKNYIFDENKERGVLEKAFHKLSSSKPQLVAAEQITRVGDLEPSIFFDCVLQFYGVIRSPCMQRVANSLVRNKRVLDIVMNMFAGALNTFERIYVNPAELSPAHLLLKEHLLNAANGLAKLSYKNDANFNCENFLATDGIEIFLRKVRKTLLPSEIDSKKVLVDQLIFMKTLDYLPSIPAKLIKKTAVYNILMEYLDSAATFLDGGGNQLLHSNTRVISETPLLKKSSDFEKWLLGGGRHIQNLAHYLEAYGQADRATSNMLHLFCLILDNNIEHIREREIPLKMKMSLVQTEVKRLQRLQDAFDSLGGCKLVLSLVGRSASYTSLSEPFVASIVPLGLKLGTALLASGNDSVQISFMNTYKKACSSDSTAVKSKYFVAALRSMIRKVIVKMENFLSRPTGPFAVELLKKLVKIYDFCASLCSGHNDEARNFLRDQHKVGETTDIVSDLSKSVDTVLSLLCDQMKYISYDKFYELLGPCVWKHRPDVKRRFIAWQEKVDYQYVCHLMATLTSGFNSLTEITQGPCLKNQPSALMCTGQCPDLLEYVGAMQLRAISVSQGRVRAKKIVWDGSKPLDFFKTYERELSRLGWFNEDPQSYAIRMAMEKWNNVGKRVDGEKTRCGSVDILGVDINMLFHIVRETEQSCLRFLLALLEASSEIVTDRLVSQLDDGILLQNMENQYKLSFDRHDKYIKYRSAATVQYLTMISTLASAQREDPTVILDDLLLEWKEENAQQGYNTEKLVASIEISSPDGSVQSVYFPIPPFVTQFWPYPEVQKSKHAILYEVNRESAEDKVGNFYELMQGLVYVMRRQERLRRLLTPPLHALFGGNNFLEKLVPPLQYCKMRPTFFAITLFFSIYYAYDAYRDEYPWIQKNEIPGFKKFWSWNDKDFSLEILAYVHIGLGAALYVREWINRYDFGHKIYLIPVISAL